MADKKITDFPEISNIGANDVFLVGGTNATYKAKLDAVKNSIGAVSKSGDTMTGSLYVPGISVKHPDYQTLDMLDANGAQVTSIRGETQSHGIVFREITPGVAADEQGITPYEDYYLPTPTNTQGPAGYYVLTSKTPVLVNQGGTGATDAASACNNLGAMRRSADNVGTVSDVASAANMLQTKVNLIPTYTAVPILMYYGGSSDSTFTSGSTYTGLLFKLDESGNFWTSSLTNNNGEMVLASRSGSSENVSFKRVI